MIKGKKLSRQAPKIRIEDPSSKRDGVGRRKVLTLGRRLMYLCGTILRSATWPDPPGAMQKSLKAVRHRHLFLSVFPVKQLFAVPLVRPGNSGQRGVAFWAPQFRGYHLHFTSEESTPFDWSTKRPKPSVQSDKLPCYFLPHPKLFGKHFAPYSTQPDESISPPVQQPHYIASQALSTVESDHTLKDSRFGQDNERNPAIFKNPSQTTMAVRSCNPIQPLDTNLVPRLDSNY